MNKSLTGVTGSDTLTLCGSPDVCRELRTTGKEFARRSIWQAVFRRPRACAGMKTRLAAGRFSHQVAAVKEFFDLATDQRLDALAFLE